MIVNPGTKVRVLAAEYVDNLPIEGTFLNDQGGRVFGNTPHPYVVEVPSDTNAVSHGDDGVYFIYASEIEVIDPLVEELKEHVTTLEAGNAILLEAEAAHEANYAALADDFREAKAAAEALADEAEKLRKCWRYALSLLDAPEQHRANGYYDASFGFDS